MDRITKAIKRARDGQPTITVHPRQRALAEITYARTRKVNHYPAWLRQHGVITRDSPAAYVEAYKVLRTRVSQRMRQNSWTTLGVTSPGSDEGKTLTAINLSISLAMESDQTVLLVDADLRRPTIHTYLGFDVELGLSDYLLQNTPLEPILTHPTIQRLVIVPGGKPITDSSEVLSSPKMRELVHELKTRYSSRLVVFDLPPLLHTDDALAFSPYVDAVLMVIEEGKTLRDDAAQAAELLKSANPSLMGTILNKATELDQRYY